MKKIKAVIVEDSRLARNELKELIIKFKPEIIKFLLFNKIYSKDDFIKKRIFVFDKNILDQSEDKADRRVDFIHQTLTRLQTELVAKGKSLWVQYGKPIEVFEKLFTEIDSLVNIS